MGADKGEISVKLRRQAVFKNTILECLELNISASICCKRKQFAVL